MSHSNKAYVPLMGAIRKLLVIHYKSGKGLLPTSQVMLKSNLGDISNLKSGMIRKHPPLHMLI
jgi:hypothetical protein